MSKCMSIITIHTSSICAMASYNVQFVQTSLRSHYLNVVLKYFEGKGVIAKGRGILTFC